MWKIEFVRTIISSSGENLEFCFLIIIIFFFARKVMRRGVLMTMLQQAAVQLPMWMGKASERYSYCFITVVYK